MVAPAGGGAGGADPPGGSHNLGRTLDGLPVVTDDDDPDDDDDDDDPRDALWRCDPGPALRLL